ncbi:MAG: 50S ribosomal protein L6 [Egibacteraceae bacterium]
MSRIGKNPVPVPDGVEVSLEGRTLRVKGPRGELEQEIHPDVTVTIADGQITVTRSDNEREHRALHGLFRSLIANMVSGVTDGYQRRLEIVGVGYRAAKQGDGLRLLLGYSHPIEVDAPEGITFDVPTPTRITVSGASKQQVGQVAANIRALRKPEPYKGKGVRYEGEQVRRKSGKAAG